MNSRTKARLRALEVLFEADQRNEDYIEVLRRRRLYTVAQISAYSEEIIRGVRDHDEEIREFVETYARDWSFERMPAVDRAVLRIGTWELLYNDEVPDAVAISEAVGLARVLSTNESPKFVNGLLDKLRQVKPTRLASPARRGSVVRWGGGGGFSVSRLRLVGAVLHGVPYWVRMRSQGLLVAAVEASPEPVGRSWWQQSRLHRTTQAGECPLCGAERLEDGAPALRVRYAPRLVSLLALSGCGRPACPVCASMHTSDMPLSAPI